MWLLSVAGSLRFCLPAALGVEANHWPARGLAAYHLTAPVPPCRAEELNDCDPVPAAACSICGALVRRCSRHGFFLVARYPTPELRALVVFSRAGGVQLQPGRAPPNSMRSAIPWWRSRPSWCSLRMTPGGCAPVGALGAVYFAARSRGRLGLDRLQRGPDRFSSLAAARSSTRPSPFDSSPIVPPRRGRWRGADRGRYIVVAWSMILLSYAISAKRFPREVLRRPVADRTADAAVAVARVSPRPALPERSARP